MNLNEQIACVQTEVIRREILMPDLVKKGKISAAQSSAEIDRMKAVLDTLTQVRNGNYAGE